MHMAVAKSYFQSQMLRTHYQRFIEQSNVIRSYMFFAQTHSSYNQKLNPVQRKANLLL